MLSSRLIGQRNCKPDRRQAGNRERPGNVDVSWLDGELHFHERGEIGGVNSVV